MGLERMVRVASSGLEVQRARMELVASNLANAQTTRTAEGGPYVRRLPVVASSPTRAAGANSFSATLDSLSRDVKQVRLSRVVSDPAPPVMRYEPGHPDANGEGYVAYPNVDPVAETVDMLSAVRSYEASVNVIKTAGRMHESALSIVR